MNDIEDFIPSCQTSYSTVEEILEALNELFDTDYTIEDLDK
jgi:hypothetical protein